MKMNVRFGRRILAGVLSLLLLCACVPAAGAVSSASFSDIQGHWAQETIQNAVEQGWVSGYPDGTFRPNATITRAEFVKMLLAATHLTPDSETIQWMKEDLWIFQRYYNNPGDKMVAYNPTLKDTADHWLTKQGWTEAALTFGLIVPSDYTNKNFQPDKNIQRYEIAVMADRALGLVYAAENCLIRPLPFSDKTSIPTWAKGYVSQAVQTGVVSGYPDGTFGPQRTATRAEAVVMIARALTYMEQGISDSVTVKMVYTPDDDSGTRTALLGSMSIQVIDNTVYISLRELVTSWANILSRDGKSGDPSLRWDPVDQAFFWDGSIYGQARPSCLWFEKGEYERGDGIGYYIAGGRTFVAMPRMLYGEVMVPVYVIGSDNELSLDRHLYFDNWDADTNTLTLDIPVPIIQIGI
jgi:hypothetical protein